MKIKTQWETRTYGLVGNDKDGYDVNDVYCGPTVDLELEVKTYNQGTPREFQSASPSDKQIRAALGLRRVQLDTDGDDLVVYVTHRPTGRPIGELHCVSHESLSPIVMTEKRRSDEQSMGFGN